MGYFDNSQDGLDTVSKVAFHTYWAGITIPTPTPLAPEPTNNFWQYFTGTDSITGYPMVGNSSNPIGAFISYAQMLPDANYTAAGLSAQLENIAQNTTLTNVPGAKELYQVQHTRLNAPGVGSVPQNDFHIRRSQASGVMPPLKRLFARKIIYLPSALQAAMLPSGAGFYVVFDWKTEGNLNDGMYGVGDFRILVQVLRDLSNNYVWVLQADNNANKNGAMTAVGTNNGGSGGYWQLRSAANTVIFDEPLLVELEYVQPPLLSQLDTVMESGATTYGYKRELTQGRATFVVTRLSTGERIVLNQQGGIMCGAYNMNMGRLMMALTYCMGSFGSDPVMWSKCTNLQVRDRADYDLTRP